MRDCYVFVGFMLNAHTAYDNDEGVKKMLGQALYGGSRFEFKDASVKDRHYIPVSYPKVFRNSGSISVFISDRGGKFPSRLLYQLVKDIGREERHGEGQKNH